ncbi:MAG: SH3 domain-containing protein [Dehalococcoidia bacterium]
MEEQRPSDPSPSQDAPAAEDAGPPDAFNPPPPSRASQSDGGDGGGVEWPESLDFLRNRFIIAGLGLLAALLLAIIILVALAGEEQDSTTPAEVSNPTPDEQTTVVPPSEGLAGRIVNTAILRNGPGSGYAILGTIPSGAQVAVVGRNEDNTWFQVVPSSSSLRGWVEADYVQVTGDVTTLVIAGPGSGPSIAVPTRINVPDEDDEPAVPTSPPQRPTSTRAAPPTKAPPTALPPTVPRPTATSAPPPPTATPP